LVRHGVQILTRSLKEFALAAEVVGAIAVIISLIYVGVSVNQNTNAVLVANHQALVAMDQVTTDWFKDPDFAAAYIVASDDVSKLSAVQRSQIGSYFAGKFNAWEFAFLTHENGMMEDNIWQGWDGHYKSVLKQGGGRWFWSIEREGFSPTFRLYVESILADIE
jgi:hypothetical protein